MKDRLYRLLAEQLRRPSGLLGRLVMTRALNQGNAELIDATVAALELQPDDRFLDAGFGGGRAIGVASELIDLGHIYGIDYSSDMVVYGQQAYRKLIAQGRLSLLAADFLDIPFRDGLMTAVSTINTIYFWTAPADTLTSFRRIMAPGARFAIGFSGADKTRQHPALTQGDFKHFRAESVVELVEGAGFVEVRNLEQEGRVSRGDHVIVAVSP